MVLTLFMQMQYESVEAKVLVTRSPLPPPPLPPSQLSSSSSPYHNHSHHHQHHHQQQQNTLRTQPATRLRKRHSIYDEKYYASENSSAPEWQNPCGGIYDPNNNDGQKNRIPVRHHLKNLKRVAGAEYTFLNNSPHEIDISNINMWFLHNYTYKFLPTLKRNSSVALKRWYRNMQTYVASFAYLRRTQDKWDRSKSLQESKTTKELHQLMISARYLLCEIETTINNSYPHDNDKKLTTVSREAMNKRLKFRTKKHEMSGGANQPVDTIDLIFVKYYYYEFLSTMWKVLRRHTRLQNQIILNNNSGSSSSSSRSRATSSQQQQSVEVKTDDMNLSSDGSSSSSSSDAVASFEIGAIQSSGIIQSRRALSASLLSSAATRRVKVSSGNRSGKRTSGGRLRQRKNKKTLRNGGIHQLNEVTS